MVETHKTLSPEVLLLFCHSMCSASEYLFRTQEIAQGSSFLQVQSRVTKSLHYENLIESRGFVSICAVKYFASTSWKDIILS